jgi:NADH:ubiquinone oxidoreductase subunit 5 (subunit L)/multisubunit Na+/H+ antiporter MnhA subunit
MRARFYFDELYQFFIRLTHEALAALASWVDRWLIAGLGVRGLSGTTEYRRPAATLVAGVAISRLTRFLMVGRSGSGAGLRTEINMLTSIILIPFLAALAMVCIPGRYRFLVRVLAILATFVTLVLAVKMFIGFEGAPAGEGGYKYLHQIPWVKTLRINYLVGVDGINVGLILMGALVAFASACVSWEIQTREKEFYRAADDHDRRACWVRSLRSTCFSFMPSTSWLSCRLSS